MGVIPYWDTPTLILYLLMGLVPLIAIKNEDGRLLRGSTNKMPIAFGYAAWAIVWLIFAVWRGVAPGLGGSDGYTYVTYFDVCLDSTSDHLYVRHSDLGFALINQAIRLLTSDYHVVFLLLYGLIVFSYIYTVKTFRIRSASLAPLIAIVYIYVRGFSSLRMNVAVAFVLLSVCLLYKGKLKSAIALAVVSIFMHKASCLYVCFLLLYVYDKKKGLSLVTCFVGMAVATIAAGVVQNLFLNGNMSFFDSGAYSSYATKSMEGGSFFDGFWKIAFGQLVLLGALVLFNKPIKQYIGALSAEDSGKAKFIRFIVLFDLATIPVTYVLGIWRGYEYLYLFRLLMWGIVIAAVCMGLSKQAKWSVNVVVIIIFSIYMGNRWFATFTDSALMPYVFQPFLG